MWIRFTLEASKRFTLQLRLQCYLRYSMHLIVFRKYDFEDVTPITVMILFQQKN